MRIYCNASSHTTPPRVVVIGGGIGGIATAGRLARAGSSVTVLEQNQILGGRVASTHLGDVRFDTGPSLLLFKDKYEEALEAMGAEMLAVERVQPAAYRVFFEQDNSYIDILNDQEAMAEQLEAIEQGAGDQYKRFVAMARNSLDLGVPNFIDRDFTELADAKGLQDLLPQLSSINPINLLAPHNWVMSRFFTNPKLKALFTFQDLYVGLSPSTAPAVFSLLAGTEITDGIWYPIGGFKTVASVFQRAAEQCGVELRTNARVARIDVETNSTSRIGGGMGKVKGVTLESGEKIPCDVVVCNRDLPAAYDLLINNSASDDDDNGASEIAQYATKKTEQLASLQYSNGVIAFNWALTKRLDALLHHNIFLSKDYSASWIPASTPDELVNRPNFYVHCPARTDPTAAPEGKDSIMVLLPVANMQNSNDVDYTGLVTEGKRRIIEAFKAVGAGDIEQCIENELVITPPQWKERYGLKFGAAFGLSHGLSQLSIFRPGQKDDSIRGLYFVGASTRPGNGVPLCLISGKLAAQRVIKDYQLNNDTVVK